MFLNMSGVCENVVNRNLNHSSTFSKCWLSVCDFGYSRGIVQKFNFGRYLPSFVVQNIVVLHGERKKPFSM